MNLKRKYFWPCMKADIIKFANNYVTCHKAKYPDILHIYHSSHESVNKHTDILTLDNQEFLIKIDVFVKLISITAKSTFEICQTMNKM